MKIETLSNEEKIRRIKLLGGEYDPESNLSLTDQLLICESVVESTPVNPDDWDGRTIRRLQEESVSVSGSVNGIRKRQENSEETQRKLEAIRELTTCNYRTKPKIIASLLSTVFFLSGSKDSHWLWLAQHYTPKSINSVIHHMTKAHEEGWVTIKNPAGYFTDVLKKYHSTRNKRRKLHVLLTKYKNVYTMDI